MLWHGRIYDTQSGTLQAEVELTPSSAWGQGDLTQRSAGIRLPAKADKDAWHDRIAKFYDRILVFMYDGQPVSESFIVDAPTYDPLTRTVGINHIGIEEILTRRWMHGVGPSTGGGGYVSSGLFTVAGVSIAGAVVRILQRAYQEPISAAWPIPVQLPAVEGGGFAKEWPFHQFQTAASMIRQLVEREDGPEMDLRPVIENNRLTRVQRVGKLTGPRFAIHIDAADSAAESVGYGLHGRKTATGFHLPGKGSDEDMRVGAAFLPVSAGLARDSIATDKNEDDVERLNATARGRLAPLTNPTVRRPIVAKTRDINPATLRRGSIIDLFSDDQFWVPAHQAVQVIGFSGKCGETYDIEVREE